MEATFSPKFPVVEYESSGGSYSIWSPSDLPILVEQKLGAGKLVLEPHSLAIPHYADSSKIGFVLEGHGTVGILSPDDRKEKVVKLGEGDGIAFRDGTVSWCYNHGTSRFSVVFLGVTPNAHVPGVFSYFCLAGTNGIFSGFSPSLLAQTWNIKEDKVQTLLKCQTGQIVVQIGDDKHMPKPCKEDEHGLVHRMTGIGADANSSFTSEVIGLSASLLKLGPNAHDGPCYNTRVEINEMVYVVKGNGKVEIVDMNGNRVLEAEVEKDCLLVAPRFFVGALVAGDQGLECLSVLATTKPILGWFAGKESLFRSLSPEVMAAAFNVNPGMVKELLSDVE